MSRNLIAGGLLARNTIWNLVGEGSPLIVAVVAIPILVQALGTERFGILTLAWLLIGYFGLFDLGVGRALTNLIAQKLGAGEDHTLPALIWTANFLMFGVGIVGGVVLASFAPYLVYSTLKIPVTLKREALLSLYLLSAALPAVISTTGFRGILEAYQRFDTANIIRIPMGVFSFVAPLAVLPFSHSLVPVVGILAIGRYLGLFSYIVACRLLIPSVRSSPEWRSSLVRPLLSFGGWMTVSNTVSPIMAGLDRVFLGALVSMQAVAFYATPYEVVTKLLFIPSGIAGVLFPAFSFSLPTDPTRTRKLYKYGNAVTALVMGPLMLLFILFAHRGLKLWLGESFASSSSMVLRVLAVGVFFNSLAQPPFALVQGAGRADWTGKLHLAELPFYLILFWTLTRKLGIDGTALAWSIRVAIDWLLLWMMSRELLNSGPIAKPVASPN